MRHLKFLLIMLIMSENLLAHDMPYEDCYKKNYKELMNLEKQKKKYENNPYKELLKEKFEPMTEAKASVIARQECWIPSR